MGVRRNVWRGRTRLAACGAIVLAVVLASAVTYAMNRHDPAASATTSTARVDRGDVVTAVATTGSLEPAQTRTLSFATGGTVTAVNVRAGDQVKTGQVLAEIDATDAQERVDDARQALDAALDEARAADDSGQAACAVADSAGVPARTVAFAWTGGASPSATPSAAASPTPSASASPTRSASQPPRPGGSAGPPHTGGNRPRGGGASSDCAGQRGGDPVLTAQQRLTSARLALAEAQDQLAGTKLKAPIAGKVLTVAGVVGTDVGAGSTFVSVADVAGMQVAADFPEADANHLEVGQRATVTLANRPGDELAARVVQVSPVGAADGNMVRYGSLLAFEVVPAGLLVGQSASVRVTTGQVTGVLRVPSTAVHGDGTAVVRTTAGDQTRTVAIGLRGDRYTEIKSGLVEGDEVVLAGA
ncbi:efflux RND transporter periplasmic adaptor subunit [Asanoa sp. NPDC049573]|uniref:efflux RND transporter periplasmic adaptor subunit n=1 Tax=Asanoa sp. NPDC049573 TaxID=3155396 RepID=UPI003436EBF6